LETAVEERDIDVRFQTGCTNMAVSRMRNRNEECILNFINGRIAKIIASHRKSGSRNAMVKSNFTSDVEIWPFRACAMQNMHYSPYYINSSVIVKSAIGQIPRSTERRLFLVNPSMPIKLNKTSIAYSYGLF